MVTSAKPKYDGKYDVTNLRTNEVYHNVTILTPVDMEMHIPLLSFLTEQKFAVTLIGEPLKVSTSKPISEEIETTLLKQAGLL